MKVILVNGSPHKEGCTYTALTEVEKELNWRERIQMGVGKFAMWLLLAGAALFIFKIPR